MAQRRYELSKSADLSQLISNQVAVKLRSQYPANTRSDDSFLSGIQGIVQAIPLRKSVSSARSNPSRLDGLYILEINQGLDPVEFCNQLLKHKDVIYAEVMFQEQLFHSPDDPSSNQTIGNQGYLDVIKAYQAWDLTTGDSDIIIGIVDTGMDMTHDDLAENYYVNEVEEINGLDDDNNGYVDDRIGFDFADNDTYPQADGNQHGTHVGGIAGASTNNGIGIASVGYNCKISALKGFTTIGTVSTGTWEGLLYAADNGYDIANLSWGNTNGYSQFFQDIIDYCVLDKDMVVVAAAGNTNADLDFYPASYDHVLSVGGSTLSDTKWSNGTYSDHIDIMAPGQAIYSTQNGNSYGTDSGSSHATPQVAGAAGLVKTVFPQYNARQIMEQLRVTTDDIYGVSDNNNYQYKLGKGRLNVFRAVSESVSRSLRVHNFSYENAVGNYAFFGDTLTLNYDLTNYLANLNTPTISLESVSPYVQILNPNAEPGAFNTLETKSRNDFKIVLSEDTPIETEIDLRFLMNEGTYHDFQNVSIITEPDDFNFGNGNMILKVTGSGELAFRDTKYEDGFPMEFNDLPVLKYAGLMIGTDGANLMDNVTNTFSIPRSRDDDFTGERPLKLYSHPKVPYYGYSEFSSADGKLWIEQTVFPSTDTSTIMIQYRVVNISGTELSGFNVGFFSDYFLGNQVDNHAYWDNDLNSIVIYDDAQSTFATIGLMEDDYHYAALDMQAVNGNTRDIDDTFTDEEKYAAMTGPNMEEAGTEGIGNDVAGLVSTSFSSIPSNGSVKFTVLNSLADSYEKLQSNVSNAKTTYSAFVKNPVVEETIYTCSGNNLTIDPSNGISYSFYKDPLGQQFLHTGNQLVLSNVIQDTAIYVANLDGSFPSDIRKILIKPVSMVADFSLSKDTLYLDDPSVNTVTFTDQSHGPITWDWDFGNGLQSSAQNPTVNFTETGTYQIQLNVESDLGCNAQITKDLVVANRPASPTLDDFMVCRNETINLLHPTGEYIVVNDLGQKVLKGENITIGPFSMDTTLAIAQTIHDFQSLPQIVSVAVNELEAEFTVYPDTTSTSTQALFLYTGVDADNYEWKVDGNVESTTDRLIYAVAGSSVSIELTVENSGCNDTITEMWNFTSSSTPAISDQVVCSGEDFVIRPANGTYFGFYSDMNLSQLISKGTSLKMENITQSQSIFIVGLDDILPSTAIEMQITVDNFSSEIVANPPFLDLSIGNTVQFKPTNPSVGSTNWLVNGTLAETAVEPILLFSTPGSYMIELQAFNHSGCMYSAFMDYVVTTKVTGINDSLVTNIYPNPVSSQLHISSNKPIQNVILLNLVGQELIKFNSNFECLNIPAFLTPGLYILEIESKNEVVRRKIKLN